jgi:aryl-alcohol dehydrogenase-like predicted oxidoreductase
VEQVERLRFLATPERTLAQAALQFVLAHPAVSVAIPGAKSAEQARANAAASGGALSAEDLNRARQVTEPAVPPSPTAPGKAPAENRRRC